METPLTPTMLTSKNHESHNEINISLLPIRSLGFPLQDKQRKLNYTTATRKKQTKKGVNGGKKTQKDTTRVIIYIQTR